MNTHPLSGPRYMERMYGKEVAKQVFGPEEFEPMPQDEYIAMKMLTRFKELKREDPKKPQPDIGWMLEILDVVRHYDKKSDTSTLE